MDAHPNQEWERWIDDGHCLDWKVDLSVMVVMWWDVRIIRHDTL